VKHHGQHAHATAGDRGVLLIQLSATLRLCVTLLPPFPLRRPDGGVTLDKSTHSYVAAPVKGVVAVLVNVPRGLAGRSTQFVLRATPGALKGMLTR